MKIVHTSEHSYLCENAPERFYSSVSGKLFDRYRVIKYLKEDKNNNKRYKDVMPKFVEPSFNENEKRYMVDDYD